MIRPFNRKRFILYLWIAIPFLAIWILSDLSGHKDLAAARIINNFWRVLYVIVLNFILFEYTVPFVTKKRSSVLLNILIAIPFFVIHVMLYAWGLYLWRLLGIGLQIYTPLKVFPSPEHAATDQMAYSMSSIVFFTLFLHIYDYIQLKQAAQKLKIEKQQAELNYLKSQTNPHFLFNTLNNIYSLAKDKSDLAPESIMRLSKILRFMLYETSGDYIAVEQELKIITDYIELEKLRYDESLRVNFNYDVEDIKQAVPPLLLIPLVENAFKHGVSETRYQPFVDIHLTISKRQLSFIVKNSSDTAGEKIVKENIGLSNLRRQMELLYSDYNLAVKQGISDFTAILNINLASHV